MSGRLSSAKTITGKAAKLPTPSQRPFALTNGCRAILSTMVPAAALSNSEARRLASRDSASPGGALILELTSSPASPLTMVVSTSSALTRWPFGTSVFGLCS